MPTILVKLFYNHSEVERWCDIPWTPDEPEAMADGLAHDISGKLGDMCEQLVRRHKESNEKAAQQIAESPRSCEHLVWVR